MVVNAALYRKAAHLARPMHAALGSRRVIEQATGILMVRLRCSSEEAFAVLARTADDRQVLVREVAAAVVAGTDDA